MMPRLALSPRDRRTLTTGIVSIAALLAFSRGAPLIRGWYSQGEARRAALRQRVAFIHQSRSRFAAVRDTLRARQTRLAALNVSVPHSPNAAAAAATIAAVVERLARNADVRVASVELAADSSARASFASVTVRMSAESDVAGLVALLTAIDRAPEPMVIRAMSISSSDPLADRDRAEVLRFDLKIEGVALVAPVRTQ